MGLYKRGSVWWMSFINPGTGEQERRSTETGNKELAKRIFDKIKGQIAEGKWFERLPGEDHTFMEMMGRYMEEHSRPKKASSERDEASLKRLLPVFSSRLMTEITPQQINQYKNDRRIAGDSSSCINRELALMKHAFNLAWKEWEWVTDNPVLRVSMEKEPPSRDRWLTHEEEKELLSVCPNWLRELILFAVETGLRRGEQLNLKWRNIDLKNEVLTVLGTKTGERRSIPLTRRAREVLEARRLPDEQKLQNDFVFTHPGIQMVNIYTLRTAFVTALEKVQMEDFRWHDLRHTFASRLAQAGVDSYAIQRLMGHKSFTTTQRYAHHYVESLRRGIAALDMQRPGAV